MEFYATISNKRLIGQHDSDYELIGKLKANTVYKIVATRPRNYEFLKKYFALINLAYENQEHFNNSDEMRAWLTMKAGFYKRVETPTGEMFQPESISFSSMTEDKFNDLYSKVLYQVCLFLDISSEDVQRELINFM